MTGRVIVFWRHKHYGFLQDDRGDEHFFHKNDLPDGSADPQQGQLVSFELGIWNGRKKAVNVRPLTPKDVLGGGAS